MDGLISFRHCWLAQPQQINELTEWEAGLSASVLAFTKAVTLYFFIFDPKLTEVKPFSAYKGVELYHYGFSLFTSPEPKALLNENNRINVVEPLKPTSYSARINCPHAPSMVWLS